MRKLVVLSVLTVLVFCLPAVAQVKFKDVPDDHWAAEAVYDLVRLGVTKGYPDGTFRGNNKISRYETAAFLSKLAEALKAAPAEERISEADIRKMVKDEVAAQKIEKVGAAVSGKVYFNYTKGLQNSSTVNNFDISRVYLTIKNKLGAKAKSKVTFDVERTTSGSSNPLHAYIKYAYVEVEDMLPTALQLVPTTVNLRLGMLPTYWIGYVDDILGIRYLAKNLTDRNGVLSSADLGVGAVGNLDLAGLVLHYDGAVINGAGYKKSESDAAKTLNLRVNSEVYPGLSLVLGGQTDVSSSGTSNRLLNALAHYKGLGLVSYGEIFYGKSALGISIGTTYDLADLGLAGIKLIGRYDSYDPNRTASDDQKTTVIAGASYDLTQNVVVALDYIADTYGSAASSNAGQTMSTINLHSQIKF